MKNRVMAEVYETVNPATFDVLLAGKPTLRKTIRLRQDKDGVDYVEIDVVTESDAHMNQFYNQAKALITKGKIHIHECYHEEYGEAVPKPCVITEEVIK